MFIHVVMMSFKTHADPAFHARVQKFAERLSASCDGMLGYWYGANEASRADGLTHAVISSFENAAAHDRYQVSPLHQEMKAFMVPFIERLVVFDSSNWTSGCLK